MQASIATITLASISPMTQSRMHAEPKLEKEAADAYDIRTWPRHMHVEKRDGKETVVIPAQALQQAIVQAAQYSGEQIPGQGKKTWTAKFAGGIMLLENPALDIDPEHVKCIAINANADGKRGSGTRVVRRFPVIPEWQATFDIYVLDAIITEDVFRRMVETAGMFIGIGQFRPQNRGTNGRFKIAALRWQDNRQIAA
jgi:hypothetical protein